jgi:hypothetical protein
MNNLAFHIKLILFIRLSRLPANKYPLRRCTSQSLRHGIKVAGWVNDGSCSEKAPLAAMVLGSRPRRMWLRNIKEPLLTWGKNRVVHNVNVFLLLSAFHPL